MDRKTMERLLIDRRLGELSPDTQRLLEAYLQTSPVDAATTEEIDSIIDLAAQAMRPGSALSPEELPLLSLSAPQTTSLKSQIRRGGPQVSWLRPLALAAAVLLAFYLGTRTTPRSSAPSDRAGVIARVIPYSPGETGEFWSVAKYAADRARLQTSDRRSAVADTARIEWTSPLVWPFADPPWREPGEKL